MWTLWWASRMTGWHANIEWPCWPADWPCSPRSSLTLGCQNITFGNKAHLVQSKGESHKNILVWLPPLYGFGRKVNFLRVIDNIECVFKNCVEFDRLVRSFAEWFTAQLQYSSCRFKGFGFWKVLLSLSLFSFKAWGCSGAFQFESTMNLSHPYQKPDVWFHKSPTKTGDSLLQAHTTSVIGRLSFLTVNAPYIMTEGQTFWV